MCPTSPESIGKVVGLRQVWEWRWKWGPEGSEYSGRRAHGRVCEDQNQNQVLGGRGQKQETSSEFLVN